MATCVDCERPIPAGTPCYLLCAPEGTVRVCTACGQAYSSQRAIFDRLRALLLPPDASAVPGGAACGGTAG